MGQGSGHLHEPCVTGTTVTSILQRRKARSGRDTQLLSDPDLLTSEPISGIPLNRPLEQPGTQSSLRAGSLEDHVLAKVVEEGLGEERELELGLGGQRKRERAHRYGADLLGAES